MSADDLHTLANKFMTRPDFSHEYRIPYTTVSDRCRKGEIALHFIDNKIQINVAEALKACELKRQRGPRRAVRDDLFA
jgi:hypothetical protein